ncbi:NAD(+) synthase [Urbifossiella limnaea]|uniref:NAD(+) synthase n=1 Tax=Urbifossiella limnaea TaxID=2528023 RepID=UPI00192E42D3|nr:NAD(+) synthase [Urbifossiella limnaea]
MTLPAFGPAVLRLDPARETDRITAALKEQVLGTLRRRGGVLGLSGGVDSSVCAALCARAFGPDRTLGVFMPEADSDPESLRLGRLVAETHGTPAELEDIAPILEAAGCYRRRDEFIRQVVPDYGPGYKSKIVLPGALSGAAYNLFTLVVQAPDGTQTRTRLPLVAYLGIVAATNMKQRTRKQVEYYHADRLNYAVVGTPNRLEYDQGFFVKNGDGAADVKPIAHLYKTQVYQLAEYLGVPAEVRRRRPTTDTYSLPQSQEEFYFALPYEQMDLCLYAFNHGIPEAEAAAAVGLTAEQVEHVFRDIQAKRRATRYLHQPPLLVEAVEPSDRAS